MIRFFRQSYAIQYVSIVLLAIALWIPSFSAGKVLTGMDSPLTPLFSLTNRILGFSPFVQLAFAFLLLLFEASIFNSILVDNQIIGKVSTLGAFLFVLLMCLTRTQANFYPFALSLLFILLLIRSLFSIFFSSAPELDLLKCGILIALASMCYFPSIMLILWMILCLPMAKKGSLRLELIPIVGFLFTYFLYFTGVFLFGDFQKLMNPYQDYFQSLRLTVSGFNLKITLLLIFLVVASVLLYVSSGNANFEKTLAVRTKMLMSLLLGVFALIPLFFGGVVLTNGLIFIVLAIVFAYEFSGLVNTGWVELFLTFFLILIFANHYYFKLL